MIFAPKLEDYMWWKTLHNKSIALIDVYFHSENPCVQKEMFSVSCMRIGA